MQNQHAPSQIIEEAKDENEDKNHKKSKDEHKESDEDKGNDEDRNENKGKDKHSVEELMERLQHTVTYIGHVEAETRTLERKLQNFNEPSAREPLVQAITQYKVIVAEGKEAIAELQKALNEKNSDSETKKTGKENATIKKTQKEDPKMKEKVAPQTSLKEDFQVRNSATGTGRHSSVGYWVVIFAATCMDFIDSIAL